MFDNVMHVRLGICGLVILLISVLIIARAAFERGTRRNGKHKE